ncbi:MAG: T9SS type A sorting domain-containing protein [Segetibacter sp.]
MVALSKTSSKQLSVAAIFPNPVYDKLNIAIVSPSSQVVTIKMNDVNGKTISQKVVSLTSGSNNLNFDVKSLSSGHYFLNVTSVDGTQKQIVQKFTKQ